MNTPAPHTPPTTEERLEAMEFLLGQMALTLEVDSIATQAQLARLERAITKAAPQALTPPTEEETAEPFTMDAFCGWMQRCLQKMREHQSATVRQMVAMGELTDRVMGLGEQLRAPTPPAIGTDVHAALERAQRRHPPG